MTTSNETSEENSAPRFAIDGTHKDGSLNADAICGPWWIYDANLQDWIAGPFLFKWKARLAMPPQEVRAP